MIASDTQEWISIIIIIIIIIMYDLIFEQFYV